MNFSALICICLFFCTSAYSLEINCQAITDLDSTAEVKGKLNKVHIKDIPLPEIAPYQGEDITTEFYQGKLNFLLKQKGKADIKFQAQVYTSQVFGREFSVSKNKATFDKKFKSLDFNRILPAKSGEQVDLLKIDTSRFNLGVVQYNGLSFSTNCDHAISNKKAGGVYQLTVGGWGEDQPDLELKLVVDLKSKQPIVVMDFKHISDEYKANLPFKTSSTYAAGVSLDGDHKLVIDTTVIELEIKQVGEGKATVKTKAIYTLASKLVIDLTGVSAQSLDSENGAWGVDMNFGSLTIRTQLKRLESPKK